MAEEQLRIKEVFIENELKDAYLQYAMSVIVGRALPRVEDGLKPVHRRIIYAMYKEGLTPGKKFSKSAGVVGEVLKKYHPHGDSSVYDAMVRMAQDWNLRYTLVNGQGNFGCFTGDTKVKLTDGRELSFLELVKEEKEGKNNYTYSVNKHNQIEIGKIVKPRLTKKNSELVKIVLDNGEEIRCTPNHRFMIRSGKYIEAKNLKEGQSLMPLYCKLSTKEDAPKLELKGYEMIKQPNSGDWEFSHILADNYNLHNKVYERKDGKVRHHRDFNKLNNNPDNIIRMKWEDHWKLHAKHASELHKNPNYVKKIAKGREKFWADQENREAYSERISQKNKKNWENSEYRTRMSKFLKETNLQYYKDHPEIKEELSKRLKKLWENQEYKEMMSSLKSEEMKKRWEQNDKTLRKFSSEESKQIWSDPKHRKYVSDLMKEIWKDESFRNARSIDAKKNWQNEEYRSKYSRTHFSDMAKKQSNDKLLDFLNKLEKRFDKITPEIYETERKNVPFMSRLETVEKQFGSLSNAVEKSKNYNHKVAYVEILNKKEDVYDLTINNTHNFALASGVFVHNSIDGDNAAAYRYTEAKMQKITERFLDDIEKETVDMIPNFDESTEEPDVLPTKIPNLLVNGSAGIAVGMATNIPPHNLGEVVDAAVDMIDNPNQTVEELVRKKLVKGPDFPTGALMLNGPGLQDIYINGEGAVTMKAVCEVEENKKGRESIIVKEIPYQLNKLNLINQLVELVKAGKIKDVTDIRDESNKQGIRLVIEIKREADPNIILNQLFQFSSLKMNFNARLLAIVKGVPTILNLKSYLLNFIDFRKTVVIRRTQYDLKKSEERLHILEGLKIALDNIDDVIALIKSSKSGPEAKEGLMGRYSLSEIQAQAILDMRLQKLTGLEMDKIREEYDEILKVIKNLKFILENDSEQYKIIKSELEEVKEQYNDERKTKIVADEGNIAIEDLIKDEDFVVMVTQNDYIKKVPLEEYRSQKRGGKGVNANFKGEDTIKNLFVSNSKDTVLIFTNDGNINWMKAYEVPTAKATMKGRPIVNYIDLRGKKITNIINVSNLQEGFLIFLTKKGIIKKTEMKNFSRPRAGGIKAINLDEGDTVLSVMYTQGNSDIIIESNVGMAIRFKQDDLSVLGRTARGVKSMNLRGEEEVVGIELAQEGKTLLTVTEKGFGKRTLLSDYPTIKRAGRGVIDIKTDKRNGQVVRMNAVGEDDELFIITKKKVIRTPVSDFRIIGRNTKGVRVVNLEDDDEILSVEKIVNEEEGEEESQ